MAVAALLILTSACVLWMLLSILRLVRLSWWAAMSSAYRRLKSFLRRASHD